MKRYLCVIMVWAFLLSLLGCSAGKVETMEIKPSELTEKEEELLNLLGYQFQGKLFDFNVDDTVSSATISYYQLKQDGTWEQNGGGSFPIEQATGRIAISFDNLGDGIRIAVQYNKNTSAFEHKISEKVNTEGMGKAVSWTATEKIIYDQEIPLAIQTITAKNEITSYNTSYFYQPEMYVQNGYEYVFAVTIAFSKEKLQ